MKLQALSADDHHKRKTCQSVLALMTTDSNPLNMHTQAPSRHLRDIRGKHATRKDLYALLSMTIQVHITLYRVGGV